MRIGFVIAAIVGATGLAACAAEPIDTRALAQARTEFQTLSHDPAASEVASNELAAARLSLSQAEDALKEEKQADVDYHSYVGIRQAKTGEAKIAERSARQQVAQFKVERERVLLEARNAELEAKNRLAAQQTSRGMVLTLSGVLFDTGKATLKPGAAPSLDRVGRYMNEYPKTRLMIEGHTDSQGSLNTNRELSQQRAEAVAEALVLRGVARGRIDTIARGADMPVASNATGAGRQQNRRVEMVFSDDGGRFAEGAAGVHR